MTDSSLNRYLERVRLRSTGEQTALPHAPRQTSGVTRAVGGACGDRVFVSVSKRSVSSPGAACAQYHEKEGVEILRDDDIAEWQGDRWSIIVSPENPSVDLVELVGRTLTNLEDRHDREMTGSAFIHRDAGNPHGHIAVKHDGKFHLTQRSVERAVNDAMKAMEKAKAKEKAKEKGMGR